jgi:hypothetical protein
MPRVVFHSIHNTASWWSYLGSRLDFAQASAITEFRGEGDWSLVDDFYRFLRAGDAEKVAVAHHGEDGSADIVMRCRVLRSLPRQQAMRMIGAMTQAVERAFDTLDPGLVVTMTMDRYVMDVMERVARARGVDFLEMTTSILPGEMMFMRRGRLIALWEPDDAHVDAATALLCDDDFAPVYVRDARRFTTQQFWKVFGYFELRAAYFNVMRYLERDPYNLHYLDSLKRLKHKVRAGDVAVLGMLDQGWQRKLEAAPHEKRVFFGLQLFPEASLDYWLRDPAMVEHDNAVVRYCEVLGAGGYRIFVKDHPLQFGFRQRELMQRLARLPFVTLVPYDVPATLLIAECAVSITFTGTIGFQAALAGLCSIVTEPYYATEQHYLHVRDFAAIDGVLDRVRTWCPPADLASPRREMIRHLARGSVPGDYFTWRKFDATDPTQRLAAEPLVKTMNTYLPGLMKK